MAQNTSSMREATSTYETSYAMEPSLKEYKGNQVRLSAYVSSAKKQADFSLLL